MRVSKGLAVIAAGLALSPVAAVAQNIEWINAVAVIAEDREGMELHLRADEVTDDLSRARVMRGICDHFLDVDFQNRIIANSVFNAGNAAAREQQAARGIGIQREGGSVGRRNGGGGSGEVLLQNAAADGSEVAEGSIVEERSRLDHRV